MGMMDGFTAETGFGKGMHKLTIKSVSFANYSGKEALILEYFTGDIEKSNKKFLFEGKLFNRKLSGWITQLGLDPYGLQDACRERQYKEWLDLKVPGRSGTFMFTDSEKINEKTGKPYLEPKCDAELKIDEYFASQNGNQPKPASNEPPIDNYQGYEHNAPFPEDIPF